MDNAIISGAFSEGWYHRLHFRRNNTPNSKKKNEIKPWVKKEWCIPEVNPEYVFRIENVLDLYNEPYDPKKPTLCLDECPYQLEIELDHHGDSLAKGKQDPLFEKKPELGIKLIDLTLSGGYQAEIVIIDAGYGHNTSFLLKIENQNLKY